MKSKIFKFKLFLFSILLCLIVSFNGRTNDDDFYASIPDSNFKQALIELGIDSDGTMNQSVLTSDISGVTSLFGIFGDILN